MLTQKTYNSRLKRAKAALAYLVNNHHGPAIKFYNTRYYLINNKYLTQKQYKAFLKKHNFKNDIKNLLDS